MCTVPSPTALSVRQPITGVDKRTDCASPVSSVVWLLPLSVLLVAVPKGVAIPSSLQNIYKELSVDIPGFRIPKHGDLSK